MALETSAERTQEKDQRKHPEVTVACREKTAAPHTERRRNGEGESHELRSFPTVVKSVDLINNWKQAARTWGKPRLLRWQAQADTEDIC